MTTPPTAYQQQAAHRDQVTAMQHEARQAREAFRNTRDRRTLRYAEHMEQEAAYLASEQDAWEVLN